MDYRVRKQPGIHPQKAGHWEGSCGTKNSKSLDSTPDGLPGAKAAGNTSAKGLGIGRALAELKTARAWTVPRMDYWVRKQPAIHPQRVWVLGRLLRNF